MKKLSILTLSALLLSLLLAGITFASDATLRGEDNSQYAQSIPTMSDHVKTVNQNEGGISAQEYYGLAPSFEERNAVAPQDFGIDLQQGN